MNQMQNIAAEMGGPLLAAINSLIKDAKPFLDFLTGAAKGYAELDDGARSAVNAFVLSAAAIGPLNLAAGKLLPMLANVVKGYRSISDAIAANKNVQLAYDAVNKKVIVTETAQAAATAKNAAAKAASTVATTGATKAAAANTTATAANTVAQGAAATVTNGLAVAVKALNLAWATNPIGLVTVALTVLIGAIAAVAAATSDMKDEQADLTQESLAQKKAVDDLRASYESFSDEEKRTGEEAARVKAELDAAEQTFEQNKKTVKELTEDIKESNDAYHEWLSSLEDAETDANAQRGALLNLAETYKSLADKENLTASEQARLRATTQQLAEKMPLLAGNVDDVNGRLTITNDELDDLIDSQYRAARQGLLLDGLKETYENLAKAEDEAAKAQAEFDTLSEEYERNKQQAITSNTRHSDTLIQQKTRLDELEASLASSQETVAGYNAQIRASEEELGALALQTAGAKTLISELGTQQSYTNEQLEAYGTTAEAVADVIRENATEAQERYNSLLAQNREDLTGLIEENGWLQESLANVGLSTEELAVKLTDAGLTVDDMRERMTAFFDVNEAGFQKIDSASKTTADEFLKNLQDWTAASQAFSENITTLYSRAGNESERQFVRYLQSLGQQGAQIANDLVNDNSGKLTELARAYEEGGKTSADGFVDELVTLPKEASELTEDTTRAVEDTAEKIDLAPAGDKATGTLKRGLMAGGPGLNSAGSWLGDNIDAGVAKGITSGSWRVDDAMRGMARDAMDSARAELEVNSPSKKSARLVGSPIVEGVAWGIEKDESLVPNALNKVMKSVENVDTSMFYRGTAAGASPSQQTTNTTNSYTIYVDSNLLQTNAQLKAAFDGFMGEVVTGMKMKPTKGW
jgi:hypothetical protein